MSTARQALKPWLFLQILFFFKECKRGWGERGLTTARCWTSFFPQVLGFLWMPWRRRRDHTYYVSRSSTVTCSSTASWSAPDHLCPPHSLLQLHQPLFVLIAFHQHSSHFHPGEALPLGRRHVALWQHTETVRITPQESWQGAYARIPV